MVFGALYSSKNYLEILKKLEKRKHETLYWLDLKFMISSRSIFHFLVLFQPLSSVALTTLPICYIFILLNRFHKKLTTQISFCT